MKFSNYQVVSILNTILVCILVDESSYMFGRWCPRGYITSREKREKGKRGGKEKKKKEGKKKKERE